MRQKYEQKQRYVINYVSGYVIGVVALVGVFPIVSLASVAEEKGTSTTDDVSAQPIRGDRSGDRKEAVEARKAQTQENRVQMEQRKEDKKMEAQENREERRNDIAQKHAERLQKRFSFYGGRLEILMEKIQTRLTVMQDEGKDMSSAEAKLDEAREALKEAKGLGNQAVEGLFSVNPEEYEEQRERALAARDKVEQAREKYQLTNTLMREVVALAKNSK